MYLAQLAAVIGGVCTVGVARRAFGRGGDAISRLEYRVVEEDTRYGTWAGIEKLDVQVRVRKYKQIMMEENHTVAKLTFDHDENKQ